MQVPAPLVQTVLGLPLPEEPPLATWVPERAPPPLCAVPVRPAGEVNELEQVDVEPIDDELDEDRKRGRRIHIALVVAGCLLFGALMVAWGLSLSSSGPRFDPNDLDRTLEWVKSEYDQIDAESGDSIRQIGRLREFEEKVRPHLGKKVKWAFKVFVVFDETIMLEMMWLKRFRYSVFVWFADMSWNLHVGREISKEAAVRLRPGDLVVVTGTLTEFHLDKHCLTIKLEDVSYNGKK